MPRSTLPIVRRLPGGTLQHSPLWTEDTASDDVQMGKAYDYLKSLIPSNFTTRPTYSEVLSMVCCDGLGNETIQKLADFTL